MILGSKPLASMTLEEMQAAIEQLRGEREALRNEALQAKAMREAKGITSDPKQPRRASIVKKQADDLLAKMLAEMENEQ